MFWANLRLFLGNGRGDLPTLHSLRQFPAGHGNYTREREAFHESKTLVGIMAETKQMRDGKG